MRFDDRLRTVLSADMATPVGAQAAWRQLIDLAGRGRIPTDGDTLTRLRALRPAVPLPVRTASARGLAFATPDAALVGFFAEDELAVAAPVLRTATLPAAAWIDLLGRLTPAGRAILRQRRDLPAEVGRGLESLGAVDFTIGYDASAAQVPVAAAAAQMPVAAAAAQVSVAASAAGEETIVIPPVEEEACGVVEAPPAILPDAPLSPTPFVALGDLTRTLPVVAEALRQVEVAPVQDVPAGMPPAVATPGRFEIADLVARIDAFRRDRDDTPDFAPVVPAVAAEAFRFETDAAGVIRAVDGVGRAALVGVSLGHAFVQGLAQVEAGVAAAVRGRRRFADVRLEVGGHSDAAGSWRIAGVPAFDAATGRFTGFSGAARRPLRHESAEAARRGASDSLRQLVHELRTPANAVAGFAELIESQLLGPVPDTYRAQAGTIRAQAADLLTAIDDLDTAARLEGKALELRPGAVALAPLLDRLAGELAPLAAQRGATLAVAGDAVAVEADDRATERLLARLLAALLSAAVPGERLVVTMSGEGALAAVAVTRPRALADLAGDALFSLDDAADAEDGAPLLGAGFTLRLVRNLAVELGGALTIGADRLILRLPVAFNRDVEQASTS